MAHSANRIGVYLETGKKRTFAGAVDWPGWCRSGHDEASALQALFECRGRYAHALRTARLGFHAPEALSAFAVVERVDGNATTDFGAPNVALPSDARPVSDADLRRMQTVLKACWQALDDAVRDAVGKELRKGPRGGGRDVEAIAQHVQSAEAAYLSRLGGKLQPGEADDLALTHQAVMNALGAAPREGVAPPGPRGGAHWTLRYSVRRLVWHVLDHAWEIEDRIQ
jgi:hypothetical protein